MKISKCLHFYIFICLILIFINVQISHNDDSQTGGEW